MRNIFILTVAIPFNIIAYILLLFKNDDVFFVSAMVFISIVYSVILFFYKKIFEELLQEMRRDVEIKAIVKRVADLCEKISVASYIGVVAPFINENVGMANSIVMLIIGALALTASLELTKALALVEKNKS